MAITRVFCRLRLLVNNEFSLVSKSVVNKNVVLLNKSVQFHALRKFRTQYTIGNALDKCKNETNEGFSSSSSSSDSDSDDDDVTVEYHRGLPQITVPLPSRRERCRFTLKPITNTVGDFLEMLKHEDRGIDLVVCKTRSDTRIASSNTIETLLHEDFKLTINDRTYNVNAPKQERLTGEEVKKIDDIKNLVNQLYEALHIEEHNVQKELEIQREIETIKQDLLPLEQQISELELVADKRGNWLAWAGLGFMSVQFGILARLTWWEYSWDIMEPVTYFVTYGTAMAMYAYYVLTKEEYILTSVRDRQQLIVLHQKAKKLGLDLQKYNTLQDQVVKLNRRLTKLKNPLKVTPKSRSSCVNGTNTNNVSPIANLLENSETKVAKSDTSVNDVTKK